jgi:hypothetical protein
MDEPTLVDTPAWKRLPAPLARYQGLYDKPERPLKPISDEAH